MSDIGYRPDRRGIAELMLAPQMHALVDRVAEEAVPFAQAISPDAPPYGAGYREAFTVEKGLVEKMSRRGGPRAAAQLVNTSEYAAAVEFGWDLEHHQFGDHEGYHVLAATADHITGRF